MQERFVHDQAAQRRLPWQQSTFIRLVGALLCIGVTFVHLEDQSFFKFDKGPQYVLFGYLVLELTGIVVAALLLFRPGRVAWMVAAMIALGPIIGYALSRGPGLPDYADDRGNWTEPLGLISLVIESALLLLAVIVLARTVKTRPVQSMSDVSREILVNR